MKLFSCFTPRVSDIRARSYLISMQDTRNGSTLYRTDLDYGKSPHLICLYYSKYGNSGVSSCFIRLHLPRNRSLFPADPDSAYYHNVVLHLFRPFLKVDLKNSKISPRDICISCARNAASLIGDYRQIYGLRRVPLITTHILLSISIIHLLNVPNPSAVQDLDLCITCLRESSRNHVFANRAVHVIMALSHQWDIQLPPEIIQRAHDLPSEIRANLTDPQVSGYPFTHLSSVTGQSQQDNLYTKDHAYGFPPSAVKNSPTPLAASTDMFWSPFPNSCVPLQAHEQSGPMDISAMLDVPHNSWDQLSRDGFMMAQLGDPIPDPPHINGNWAHA